MKRKRFKLQNVSNVSTRLDHNNSSKNRKFSKNSSISSGTSKKITLAYTVQSDILNEKPYIKADSELIIPSHTPDKYRWWSGGQSIFETLLELNAPDSLIKDHIGELGSPKHYRQWQKRRKKEHPDQKESLEESKVA